MSLPRPIARRVLDIELPARRWSGIVDGAIDRPPDFTRQSYAARLRIVGPAQADDGWRDGLRHGKRHALAPGKGTAGQLDRMKIDAKAGAAGAASLADTHAASIDVAHLLHLSLSQNPHDNATAHARKPGIFSRTASSDHRSRKVLRTPAGR
jgi:hypothetical protein